MKKNDDIITSSPKRFFTKRRMVLLVVVLVFLAALGFVGVRYGEDLWKRFIADSEVAFSIDGKDYSKDEIEELIDYPTDRGESRQDAAKKAFEYLKRKVAAEKAGIVLTQAEIDQAKKEMYGQTTPPASVNQWLTLVISDLALDKKLENKAYTAAKGYYYEFPFSDHLDIGEDIISDDLAGSDDSAAAAEDRKYAKAQADKYIASLDKGEVAPKGVLAEIQANSRLGRYGVAGSNTSFRFNTLGANSNEGEIYLNEDQKNYIFELANKKGPGDLKIGTISSFEGDKEKKTEASFYFVYIDEPAPVQSAAEFNSQLKKLKTSYNGI